MAKHTPPPWEITPASFGTLYRVSHNGYFIANVRGKENAQLVAAAPMLLAALHVMLRDYAAVHDIGDLEMQPALRMASTAITMAEGEQP